MGNENPYDAPALPSFKKGPPADEHTEVSLRQKRARGVLPVDDETNFGDLDSVIGSTASQIDEALLDVDPHALAARLAGPAEVDDPQPLPSAPPQASSEKRRELTEDEPTILGGPAGKMDPTELARHLAEQAKARIAAQQTTAPPRKENPADLAKRLAREAKARIAASQAPAPEREAVPTPDAPAAQPADSPAAASNSGPTEDPAALARRLAAEAKARLRPQPSQARDEPEQPAPEQPEPAESADEPDPKNKKKRKKKRSRRSSLADRAPRKKSAKSAVDALKVYTAEPSPERQAAPEEPREAPPQPAVEAAPVQAERLPDPVGRKVATPTPPPMRASEILSEITTTSPSAPAPVPAEEPVPEAPAPEPEPEPEPAWLTAIRELLPGVDVQSQRPVRRPAVFIALWEAHQARAVKDGQLELAGAATLLLAHARGLPEGKLMGLKLMRKGKAWAAFVDLEAELLLAIVPRPEIYLAGLQ